MRFLKMTVTTDSKRAGRKRDEISAEGGVKAIPRDTLPKGVNFIDSQVFLTTEEPRTGAHIFKARWTLQENQDRYRHIIAKDLIYTDAKDFSSNNFS